MLHLAHNLFNTVKIINNITKERFYILLCLITILTSNPAHAYLDPVSIGMFFQMLIGGIAAGFALVVIYWNRLKIWIKDILGLGKTSKD